MNITFFYQKLDAEYFLFNNFFEKSSIFGENREKLFRGHIWQLFRKRRRLAPKINITFLSQMRYWIFYYLAVFSKKKSCIFWENGKKQFLGPGSLLKGRRRLTTKMNLIFLWEMKLWNLTFFRKGQHFGRKWGKKFLGDMTIF